MFSFCLNLIKKRSILIIISDFIDEEYEQPLKSLANRHDVIVIQVTDPLESALPSLGIIPVYDKELGKTTWVNTAFGGFSRKIYQSFHRDRESLRDLCKKNQINYLQIDTRQDIVLPLMELFKIRNRSMKRG